MKNLAKIVLGMSVAALWGMATEVRADQIVVRLIQASNKKAADDPQLADLLPDFKKRLRWPHYEQVAVQYLHALGSGTERVTLGNRLKLEITSKGLVGKKLDVDVKLLLDDKPVLTQPAKLGDAHVCIGGEQAGDEGWIIDLQRR